MQKACLPVLGVTLKSWLTPKSWSTPEQNLHFCMILSGFPLIFYLLSSVSDGKSCFSIRKSILTSARHAEHLFAGQNTQQIPLSFIPWRRNQQYKVSSLSVFVVVLGQVSQMIKLRQLMRKLLVYLNTLSLGIITFFRTFEKNLTQGNLYTAGKCTLLLKKTKISSDQPAVVAEWFKSSTMFKQS